MENIKHIAWRTCIATGEKKDKRDMIRFVKKADGSIVIDLKGKEKGRGANLSMSIDAFDLALKKKAFERALKLEKKLNDEDVVKLREEFNKAIEEKALRKGNKKISLKVDKKEFEKATKK